MPTKPVISYIGLGANLGQSAAAVLQACEAIAALDGVELVRRSSLYTSAPVQSSGPDYVNAVVEVLTVLPAHLLLEQLQKLEQAAGRQRPYVNAPRTLDLDILLYGDQHIDSPTLTVPHPRMWQRAFVLQPLCEVAAHLVSSQALEVVQDQRTKPLVL